MKSIVVLISGNGSNLQAIIDHCAQGKIAGNVTAVISNKADVYGLERAANSDIPAHVIKHNDYVEREPYDKALQACIDQYQPDLVVLAGFMRILTADFVNHYAGKMVNIHPSLLPKYKGLHTHQRAIDAGDKEHGASVHFVTADLDGGPIIIQSKVPIFAADSADELAERVQEQERLMYPAVVNWYCQERLTMQDQQVFMDGQLLGSQGYAAD